MTHWAGVVLATLTTVPLQVPSYPGARQVAPTESRISQVSDEAGVRLLETPDGVAKVCQFYLAHVPQLKRLSDGTRNGRRSCVVGIDGSQPLVSVWREDGESLTHLLLSGGSTVEKKDTPAVTEALAPAPTGVVFDLPIYPGAERDEVRSVSGGGSDVARDVATFSTDESWGEVAAFYRHWVPGDVRETHDGLDRLVITMKTSGRGMSPSVEVVREPGSPVTRVVLHKTAH